MTGPIAFTLAVASLIPLYPHRLVDSDADLGLEYTTLSGLEAHRGVFEKHYSKLSESIVTIKGKKLIAVYIARLLDKLWSLVMPGTEPTPPQKPPQQRSPEC